MMMMKTASLSAVLAFHSLLSYLNYFEENPVVIEMDNIHGLYFKMKIVIIDYLYSHHVLEE